MTTYDPPLVAATGSCRLGFTACEGSATPRVSFNWFTMSFGWFTITTVAAYAPAYLPLRIVIVSTFLHPHPRKGWLEEAKLTYSGLTMHEGDGGRLRSDGLRFESGEVEDLNFDEAKEFQLAKLVAFPGFNAPPPDGFQDESRRYSVMPYSRNQVGLILLLPFLLFLFFFFFFLFFFFFFFFMEIHYRQ